MNDVELKHNDEFYSKLNKNFTFAGKTFNIAARGNGKSMKSLRKAYEDNERRKLLENLDELDDHQMTVLCGLIANDLLEQVKNRFEYLCQELEEVQNTPYIPDISSLKKQIKHCKNLMEKKRLEQELNRAYKEMKKK